MNSQPCLKCYLKPEGKVDQLTSEIRHCIDCGNCLTTGYALPIAKHKWHCGSEQGCRQNPYSEENYQRISKK